jgi:hypothetical protein
MKSIIEYINEGKSWSFSEYQRQSLGTAIGFMTGNLGDADEIARYEDFKKSLSDKELKQFNDLFDLFDDEHTYKKINSRMVKDEMEILKRFAQYIEDNDLADGDWDLIDAYEKILY